MGSREEMEVAIKVKRIQIRVSRLESACKHGDVAGMLSLAAEAEHLIGDLRDTLKRLNLNEEVLREHGSVHVEAAD